MKPWYVFPILVLMLGSFALRAQDDMITDEEVLSQMTSYLHHLNQNDTANIQDQLKFLERIKPIWKNSDFQKLRKIPAQDILINAHHEQDNPYYIAALAFNDEEMLPIALLLTPEEKSIAEKIIQFRDQVRGHRGYNHVARISLNGAPFLKSLKFVSDDELDILTYESDSKKFRTHRIGLKHDTTNMPIRSYFSFEDHAIISPEAAPIMKDLSRDGISNLVECFIGSAVYVFSTSDGAVIAKQLKIDDNDPELNEGVGDYYYLLKPPNGHPISSVSLAGYPLENENDDHSGYLIAVASEETIYLWHMYQGHDSHIYFDPVPSITIEDKTKKVQNIEQIQLSTSGDLAISTYELDWANNTQMQHKLRFYKWNFRKERFTEQSYQFNLPAPTSNLFLNPSGQCLTISLMNSKVIYIDLENMHHGKITHIFPFHGHTTAIAFKPSDSDAMIPSAIGFETGLIKVRRGDSFDTSLYLNGANQDIVISDLMYEQRHLVPIIDLAFYKDDMLISLSENGDLNFWKLGVIDPDLSLIRLVDLDKAEQAEGGGK